MPADTPDVRIRHADATRDAAACASVYRPFVTESSVSFETVPPDAAEFAERIERNSRTHAWLVSESGGEVTGFAYGGTHRARAAYRWAVEVSVYIRADHWRRGVGRALYGALLPLLARQGMRVALAGITLPNEGSVALHEAIGFEPIGVYRAVGWKAGAWRDVGWWELELAPATDEPPVDPGPPQRLDAG